MRGIVNEYVIFSIIIVFLIRKFIIKLRTGKHSFFSHGHLEQGRFFNELARSLYKKKILDVRF